MTHLVRSPLAHAVTGCAITVHRALGPGLLESSYLECLGYELAKRGLSFRTQVALPICYDGHQLNCGYRLDLVIADALLLEVKSVERILPVHMAQTMTYLKLSGLSQALLLNFNVTCLRDGIRSFLQASGRIHNDQIEIIDDEPLVDWSVQPPT